MTDILNPEINEIAKTMDCTNAHSMAEFEKLLRALGKYLSPNPFLKSTQT